MNTNDNLLDFNWEGDGEDFFNLNPTVESTTPPNPKEIEEEEEEEETETTETVDDETTSTEDAGFFDEEETEDTEDTTDTTSKPKSDNIYSDLYKDLKEQGILKHVELEEGEEIDSDKLFELQQQDYEEEVSARLKSWATEELDEDAKAFIKFKRDGGNTSDFFKTYSSSSELPSGDISEESHQDSVIRHQLKNEGWDSDEVEDRLRYLTENGKKEQVAKKYNTKLKEADAAKKQEALKKAEKTKETVLQQEQEFKTNIKGVLDETQEVNGVKITSKDKTQLYNFLTKKSYKLSDTKSVTGFQKKLGEAFQDTSKMILLAKLVSSDFDMKEFEKATVTKKTQQIKSNLEQRKNLRPTNSGSSLEGNSLADLFN